MKTSKNNKAKEIVGLRETKFGNKDVIFLDQPCEVGYHCPVCKYELVVNGNYDERLTWSEYNGFLWCEICNKDYPTTLCATDIDRAIEIYLKCIEEAKKYE